MAFLRRLGWYLVGLSIGIVFLVFFFKKKTDETGADFCYFPNCRVLKDLRSKPLEFSKNMESTSQDTLLVNSFLTDGDIDFGKSDTKSEPCKIYYISKEVKGVQKELKIKNCPQRVILEGFTN